MWPDLMVPPIEQQRSVCRCYYATQTLARELQSAQNGSWTGAQPVSGVDRMTCALRRVQPVPVHGSIAVDRLPRQQPAPPRSCAESHPLPSHGLVQGGHGDLPGLLQLLGGPQGVVGWCTAQLLGSFCQQPGIGTAHHLLHGRCGLVVDAAAAGADSAEYPQASALGHVQAGVTSVCGRKLLWGQGEGQSHQTIACFQRSSGCQAWQAYTVCAAEP